MATPEDEKVLHWPSAVAFIATIAASIALFAMGHRDYGALVLLGTLGLAAPQPLRGDK